MIKAKGKTYSDKNINEDVYYISDSCVFVMDGATGLSNNTVMSEDDAYWFVNRMKEEIVKRLNIPFVDMIKESIEVIQKEYKLDVNTLNKKDMPSACLSLFRERNGYIEYLGLGDSVGIVELNNAKTEVYYDKGVEILDHKAIEKMNALSKKYDKAFLETRKYVNEDLLNNRNLRNTKEGFYALDLTLDCLNGMIIKRWKIKEVKMIACMSDGFYQLLSFKNMDLWELLNSMENNLDELFLKLYEYQKLDADCIKVPRLKIRDDTTAVIGRIYNE